MDYIAENIRHIRAQMEEAALRAGRDPKEILLCAATKMNPAEAVRAAIAGGVSNLDVALLAGMAVCGILGGIAGRAVNKHIDDAAVDKLFCGLMVAIILISGFNVVRYCG